MLALHMHDKAMYVTLSADILARGEILRTLDLAS